MTSCIKTYGSNLTVNNINTNSKIFMKQFKFIIVHCLSFDLYTTYCVNILAPQKMLLLRNN